MIDVTDSNCGRFVARCMLAIAAVCLLVAVALAGGVHAVMVVLVSAAAIFGAVFIALALVA